MNDRLIDLFGAVGWKPVEEVLRKLDPEGSEGVPELYIYRRVFEEMRQIVSIPTDDWLEVERFLSEPDEDGERESWVEVSSIRGGVNRLEGDGSRIHPVFVGWAECLGMRVSARSRDFFSAEEIVAHTLWTMTRAGTDEETIQAVAREMSPFWEARDIAVPSERVLRELGLWTADREEHTDILGSPEACAGPVTRASNRVPFLAATLTDIAAFRWNPDFFARGFAISGSNLREWSVNQRNLFLSSSSHDGPRLERIRWHPLTGEMILSDRGECHGDLDIRRHGSHPPDEYVKAAILPDMSVVAISSWIPLPSPAIRHFGRHALHSLSAAGQLALTRLLRRVGLPTDWRVLLEDTLERFLKPRSRQDFWENL